MFTFGIFATHLPYIAFVVFYAGLFIFGGEKSTAEDIAGGEGYNSKVIAASDASYHDLPGKDWDVDYFDKNINLSGQKIYLAGITFTPGTIKIPYKESNYHYSWFSRPPPAA